MDDTFINNHTMMKAHELGYQVVFNRNGQFKGYKGYPAIIYTRFLEAVASGLAMRSIVTGKQIGRAHV